MSKKVTKDRVEIKNAIEVNQEQIKRHLNELWERAGTVATRLRHIAGSRWGTKKYMDVKQRDPAIWP